MNWAWSLHFLFFIITSPLAYSLFSFQLQASVMLNNEKFTSLYFNAIKSDTNLLAAFLHDMPKGGDLHNHLSGSVYAESYIAWAADDGLCINTETLKASSSEAGCSGDKIKMESALKSNNTLYQRLIDGWSMRQNVLTGHSDHDHFFSTFEKFSSISRKRIPHMLAEVAKRSEHEKLSYLELMLNLDNGSMAKLSKEIEWTNNYEQQHRKILGYTPINSDAPRALSSIVLQIRNRLNDVENEKRKLLGCDNDMSRQIIGCNVVTRYIYQVNRSQSDHQVFSQIVLAFELAKADKRFVGLNFVQPEDSQAALENFNNQMDMLNYLRSVYSEGHITLHAGELAPGLTTPEALHDHIAKSVRVGQAERIGHGVDIMYENAPYATLHYMSSKGVLVEVCLSSNRLILGTKGENSPLKTYMQFGVPVTLATDDAGVNRSTISQEYQYAIEQVNLTYPEVKKMVRNSLEFSFFEGDSLWSDRGSFISRGSCTSQKTLSEACVYMLERSPKAKLQWQLETDFATFEAKYASYFLK